MKRIGKSQYARIFLLFFVLMVVCFEFVDAQSQKIKNDMFWYTKNGLPIYSQGGGIFNYPDPETGQVNYYWNGVHYKEAERYRNDPSVTQSGNGFEGVTCYSPTDLVNWKFESNVLTPEEVFGNQGRRWGWLGRVGVAYVLKSYS